MRNKLIMRISLRGNRIFDAALFCLIFYLSFSYFLYGYRYFDLGTYHYDEGITAYGALRILDGYVPYRDFWTLYNPGEFYVLAVIFKIFGISIEVTRLFAIMVLSLTVSCIYLLIKKLCPRILGVLAFFLALVWLKSYMVFNRPGQLAILFFILCSFSLINFLNSGRKRWLFIAGVVSGVTGLFRQDFGVYIFTSIFLVILLRQLNLLREKEFKLKLGSILKNELYLFFGFFIVFLPLFIYLIANSASREFINDTVIFTVTIYPKVRNLPFPQLKVNTLIFYLPLFVFLLTCIRLLFYKWKDKIKEGSPWLLLFFLFSGLGIFNYTNVRTCMPQLLPTIIPGIILFVLIFNDFLKKVTAKIPLSYKSLIFTASSLVCFALLFYLTQPSLQLFAKDSSHAPDTKNRNSALNIDRARGFYDDPERAKSLSSAVRYIQDNTGENEKIFVGNLIHDKAVNSDVMFYFLSGRHSATKYYELHPGLTETKKIQKEIINDLIKANVRYIILSCETGNIIDVSDSNESSKSSGVKDLDNFIGKNYKIERVFGRYLILKRA